VPAPKVLHEPPLIQSPGSDKDQDIARTNNVSLLFIDNYFIIFMQGGDLELSFALSKKLSGGDSLEFIVIRYLLSL
jgi:hypothetical protein